MQLEFPLILRSCDLGVLGLTEGKTGVYTKAQTIENQLIQVF